MLKYVFYVLVAFLVFDVFVYLSAVSRLKKVKKKYPDLYVIGYKNSQLFLGYKSDSSVSPVGLIPCIRAKCFEYDHIPSIGSKCTFIIKPVFSLTGSDLYKASRS